MYRSPALDALPSHSLRKLHRNAVDGPAVRDLLGRAQAARVVLDSGVDRRSEPRTARILTVCEDRLELDAPRLSAGRPQTYLHFDLEGVRSLLRGVTARGRKPLLMALPTAIYEAERWELQREPLADSASAPRVRLRNSHDTSVEGLVRDWSYRGMAGALPVTTAPSLGQNLVGSLKGKARDWLRVGEMRYSSVRCWRASPEPRLSRLDLATIGPEPVLPFPFQSSGHILPGSPSSPTWRRPCVLRTLACPLQSCAPLPGFKHCKQAFEAVFTPPHYPTDRNHPLVVRHLDASRRCGGSASVPAWPSCAATSPPPHGAGQRHSRDDRRAPRVDPPAGGSHARLGRASTTLGSRQTWIRPAVVIDRNYCRYERVWRRLESGQLDGSGSIEASEAKHQIALSPGSFMKRRAQARRA